MGASPFFKSFVFLMKNKTLKDARFITLIYWLKLRNHALWIKWQNIVNQCKIRQTVGLNPRSKKVPRFSLANMLWNPTFCLCKKKINPWIRLKFRDLPCFTCFLSGTTRNRAKFTSGCISSLFRNIKRVISSYCSTVGLLRFAQGCVKVSKCKGNELLW